MQQWADGFQRFQPNPNQARLDQQLMARLFQYMDNPNAYDSDLVVGSYNRLNNLLTQQGDIERTQIGEEMARRGVGDSTIHGGRLGDVAIQQARARSDLSHQLLEDAARQEGSAVQSALGMGMGYGQQMWDRDFNTWQANEQGQRGRMQDALGYDQWRFTRWLQEMMANHQMDIDNRDFWFRLLGY
jgi:hypothetical protein